VRSSCRYLKTTMKSNTTEFQYENSFWIILKRLLSRNRWWKREFHHQKNLNCLRLMIHHHLNQRRLAISLQSRYRDFFFEKKLQTKKWLIFLEKINHWTKKIIFLFERKVFFVQTHRSYRMSSSKLRMLHWMCWHREILIFE
jgi:hypothetical protein